MIFGLIVRWGLGRKSDNSIFRPKTTVLFSKIKTYLTGMHPTSVHLIGGCLMGVHLTGVHLTGVYVTGVYLIYESSLRAGHGWRESLYRHPGWFKSF
jgi:hypothetical protein